MSVLVCILHVRELRSIKGFGEAGGGKAIVKRTRVVVIHCKVNTTSGLTGRVDAGKILQDKSCQK